MGDVVVLREDIMVPAKWPIARVTKAHTGKDGLVRAVTVKTSTGIYTRPVVKVALLYPTNTENKFMRVLTISCVY